MNNMLQDLRYALRMLRKSPGLSAAVVLSLAIGIGANSAIFSVVHALLLNPLPYPQPDRLADIWLHSPGIGIFLDWPSPGQYIDIRNENHSFEDMAIARLRNFILMGRERPELVDGMRASSSLLNMLGAKPLMGRLLLPEEDKPGKSPVAILSYRLWSRMFNSDAGILGKSITLSGESYVVAGVLRPEFVLSSEAMPAEGPMEKADVFVPLPFGPDAVQRRGDENYNILVRLKPGVSVQQAQADIDIIASRIREKDKRDRTFGMTVVTLQDQVVGDIRRALLVLFGSVALVLLIACANVANLLLARAAGRQKEVAIRSALGAGAHRIIRQLLTESVLLAMAGGVVGLMIAELTLRVVRTLNPGNIPRLDDIHINGAVLAFTLTISLVTGVLFGLAPALRAMKVDLNTSLKSGGRSAQGDSGIRIARNRMRGLLVVSELAISLMLLIGAGLLIRSYARLQAVPPGFATDHVISMQVGVAGPQYKDSKEVTLFYRRIADRILQLPGVVNEGVVSSLPLTGSVGWGGITVEGYTPPPGQELQVDIRLAGTDYFRAMQIPLLKGRFFSTHDNADSPLAAIIDEKFAQRFWPHDNPVGKRLWFDPKKPMTIVGVAGIVKQYGLDNEGKIAVYFPHQQQSSSSMFLVTRTSSEVAGLGAAIEREIHSVDPNAAVYDVRTMQERLSASLARQRFSTAMLGAFAGFALLLASLGVYSVMSYLVSQSTRDIGVRVALGAQRGNILRLVMSQGVALVAIGIVGGVAGAIALTRVMASLLFGVTTTDPLTFSSVCLILGLAAFAATVIPAFRATRIDPMVALREE
jgi:predicted permease